MAGAEGNTFRSWPCCPESRDLPYMNPLDTLPKIPNRAPNPAISMEYGNLTSTDMSGRFGFISFTLSKASARTQLSLKRMMLIDNFKPA